MSRCLVMVWAASCGLALAVMPPGFDAGGGAGGLRARQAGAWAVVDREYAIRELKVPEGVEYSIRLLAPPADREFSIRTLPQHRAGLGSGRLGIPAFQPGVRPGAAPAAPGLPPRLDRAR